MAREAALALGERLIGVCTHPFDLDGFDANMSVTIGAALLDSGDDAEQALRNADLALYAAKSARRGSIRLFEPPMRERVLDRVWIEHHLRHALDRDELTLVYEPVWTCAPARSAAWKRCCAGAAPNSVRSRRTGSPWSLSKRG